MNISDVRVLAKYSIVHSTGTGGFSKVFLGMHNHTGSKVAIKMISNTEGDEDGMQLKRIENEIRIQRQLDHPFIPKIYEIIRSEDYTYIVMEYLQNGMLYTKLLDNGPYCEEDAQVIFGELILALKHIHSHKVVHHDIKLENIMIDNNRNIRLIDYGLSIKEDDAGLKNHQTGSTPYAAPEVIKGKEYTYGSDIWSCGIVLYALLFGSLPFDADDLEEIGNLVVNSEINYPTTASDDAVDLLKKLLAKSRKSRISMENILKHPWIAPTIRNIQEKIDQINVLDESIDSTLMCLGLNPDDKTDEDVIISKIILTREAFSCRMPCLLKPRTNMRRRRSYISMQAANEVNQHGKLVPKRNSFSFVANNVRDII